MSIPYYPDVFENIGMLAEDVYIFTLVIYPSGGLDIWYCIPSWTLTYYYRLTVNTVDSSSNLLVQNIEGQSENGPSKGMDT
eukprot:scaffold3150_cov51-Attheya_sp.AAC.17